MSNTTPILIHDRRAFKVTGPDRVPYLQGLITNDMGLCTIGSPIYTAMLTANGRFLYDFFVIADDNALYLTVPEKVADVCFKKLSMYKLRAQVDVSLSDLNLYYLSCSQDKDARTFKDPRLAEMGTFTLRQHMPEATEDMSAYHLKRYGLGAPDYQDMTPEKSIILEYGFDELHGISWTKGCYMGQELMARTKHQGLIRKRIMILRSENDTPLTVGDSLFRGDTKIGRVVGSAGTLGMGLIRLAESGLDQTAEVNATTEGNQPVVAAKPKWLC